MVSMTTLPRTNLLREVTHVYLHYVKYYVMTPLRQQTNHLATGCRMSHRDDGHELTTVTEANQAFKVHCISTNTTL